MSSWNQKNSYRLWQWVPIVFIAILSIVLFRIGLWFGLLGIFTLLITVFIPRLMKKRLDQDYTHRVLNLTQSLNYVSQSTLDEMPFGVFMYDYAGKIQWHNPFVSRVFEESSLIGEKVTDLLPDLSNDWMNQVEETTLTNRECTYRLYHHRKMKFFFLQDVSEEVGLRKAQRNNEVVVGYIHIDNLEEAVLGLTDQEETVLMNNVTNAISTWASHYKIALKRLETDKMLFITQYKVIEEVIKHKFDILDIVREVTQQNKIPVTLSLGCSSVGGNMADRLQYAQSTLDIALARGGDQAAVQEGDKIRFYGGKTNAVEKRTRVKARAISQSMSKLIHSCSRVLVMGHKNPDMDAIGSAIGVMKLARIHEKESFLILDEENSSIDRLMVSIRENEFYRKRIISPLDAYEWLNDSDTLLVIVDTHKPSLVIDPKLLEGEMKIVVIDHHRRGEDFVDHAVITYVEPYSSSTCELVTELIQYQNKSFAMDSLEATALLTGIVVDTQNFTVRAGSRTFEAASYLRQQGADLMMVRALLKEDLEHFLKRAELIRNTELLNKKFAVAIGKDNEIYDQLQIAQAADTLLHMKDIVASFVIGKRADGLVSISARSDGKLNVQVLMEEFQGGGHLTNAAAQIQGGLEEAKEKLVNLLHETQKSGGVDL
ncbi:DHH family phosphoesterase [Risungbinella massiliensis]|uniref:DHH family phosphoesterase n=1 Tax=Risungbinella massiliensis TaxID=1329796 RepID=UPI0005CBD17D|nr:DHH family phosphoesterase [Risungbinella massiliensis]